MEKIRERKINMYCPTLLKTVEWVAWEEQNLDLGSIARSFGLDPWTLKLNGHFISRGVDFISSSVTWKSLLSFFSDKGLSTGKDEGDALIVDGKLSKLGFKRAYDPREASNEIRFVTKAPRDSIGADSRRPFLEDTNLLKSQRIKENNLGCGSGNDTGRPSINDSLGFKRKQLWEDLSSFKKLKIKETSTDVRQRSDDISKSNSSSTQFRCNLLSGKTKRMREDEAIVAAPCKKNR